MHSAELFLSLAGQYTLIVVEHDMAFVEKIADTVTFKAPGRYRVVPDRVDGLDSCWEPYGCQL